MPFTVSYVNYRIYTFSCIVVTAILEAVPFSGENADLILEVMEPRNKG